MAISTYAYHNIDNGFDEGYHQTGFGLGLPLTLITALIGSTQGGLPGLPRTPTQNRPRREAVNNAGWSVISAAQLGYAGKTDARGTYYGETAGYTLRPRCWANMTAKAISPPLASHFAVPAAHASR